MPDLDRFLGTWELIPELSLYEGGKPPAEGRHVIEPAGEGAVHIRLRWRMPDAAEWQEVVFGGPTDGTPQLLPNRPALPGAPDRFTITRVDAGTLDSATALGAQEIASVHRVASKDGELLAVLQVFRAAAGSRVRNVQVYRRERA
jgi:hypothetical protein